MRWHVSFCERAYKSAYLALSTPAPPNAFKPNHIPLRIISSNPLSLHQDEHRTPIRQPHRSYFAKSSPKSPSFRSQQSKQKS
jgi:hypothetical protein